MTTYYTPSGNPPAQTRGTSPSIRAEFALIQTGFTGVNADLQAEITARGVAEALLAPRLSPTFTGTPVAPTAAAGTNTTQLATTAFVAAAGLNASLPGQLGNSGKYITTDGSTASWGTIPTVALTSGFASAAQTITAAGALTIAHGLGVAPKVVLGFLTCTSADANYSAGNVLCVPLGQAGRSTITNAGTSVSFDATNLYVRYGAATGVFAVIDKSNGNDAAIDATKWTFSLRAFA